MKYYIIAGEASGDLYGAELVKDLKSVDPKADFMAWGGDKMKAQGIDIRKHIKDLAFMGFVEVVMKLRTISNNFTFCKEDITHFAPDALILIDYPGFNLRMAKWAHEKGINVYYYISPQIWAWKSSRIKKIKAYVDKLFVILPFEKDYYAEREYGVEYVGHPLVDIVKAYVPQEIIGLPSKDKTIAVLPGSRDQEISKILPRVLPLAQSYPDYLFVIAGAPNKDKSVYHAYINANNKHNNIVVVENRTYDILAQADAALVASGTATLETALFNVPEIVCYYGSSISIAIARRVINIKYISLVNLILDKEVVKELIQGDLNPQTLKAEFDKITTDKNHLDTLYSNYKELHGALNINGASQRVANWIYTDLSA